MTMMKRSVPASLVLAIGLAGGAVMAEETGPRWTYSGPKGAEHWGELSGLYRNCSEGKMESPVDLAGASVIAKVQIDMSYLPVPLGIVNNGHTVQLKVANGSAITIRGIRYDLMQIHFHTPSEHLQDRRPHAMEVHFVHLSKENHVAVVAAFFDEGNEHRTLAKLIDHVPMKKGEPTMVEGVTIDPQGLLPQKPAYYHYSGSLTTPPCTEGVFWFIARTPMTASRQQIETFMKAMGANARPIQPLGRRVLIEPME